MKICSNCGSLAFDDMPRCYDCMQPFQDSIGICIPAIEPERDVMDDLHRMLATDDLEFPIEVEEAAVPAVEFRPRDSRFEIRVTAPSKNPYCKFMDEGHPEMGIGRSLDNDIVSENPSVSRHHAKLSLIDGALWLTDLQSQNMTKLNGRPVLGTCKVEPPCKIGICDMKIEVISSTK